MANHPRLLGGLIALLAFGTQAAPAASDLVVNANAWQIIPRESGPVNYYRVAHDDPAHPYVHASYEPGYKTAVVGFEVAGDRGHSFHQLKWKWRADVLPRGGNECARGAEDSAAVVYLTWKRGLRWYSLKYVWSAVGPKGAICSHTRSLFVATDTIILETGGPLGQWREETIALDDAFRAHFGDDDIPDFQGLGLMTDGDQTRSESAADYADFVLSP